MSMRFYCRLAIILCFAGLIGACNYVNQSLGPDTPDYQAEVFNAKLMTGILDPVSSAFLLAGREGSIWRSEDGLHWSFSNAPTLSTINHIAVDGKSGLLVAVADEGVIIRSGDGGRSWQSSTINAPENVDLKTVSLKTAAHHPGSNTWLAAGSHNAILRSTDQGKTWQLTSYVSSEDRQEILALFVEPDTGDIFFGAQYGTTGRSKNAGVDWQVTHHDMEFPGSYIPHVVGFYKFGDTFIAAADEGRLLVSKDSGENWQLFKVGIDGYFTGATYDPIHKSIVFSTQPGEVVYSKDNGASWTVNAFRVKNWPSDDIPLLSGIHYDETTKSLILIGNSGIVARSKDGGETWDTNVIKPLFNLSVTTLLHDPARNLFVATGLGGFILTSQGLQDDILSSWKLVRPGIDLYMRAIIHIPDTDTFVMVGQLGGIWRSENDGISWELIEPKYPYPNQPPHLRDIIIDPQTKALVAAGPDGSIMRSTDAGKTWTPVFQGVIQRGEAFTKILIDNKHESLVAYETLYRSVYISKDGGISWAKESTVPTNDRNIWHGDVSEKLGLLLVTGAKGAISVSNDGGHHWNTADIQSEFDMYGAFADEDSGALLVVGQRGTIYRSEDGMQWQSIDSGTQNTLRRIVKEPKTGALLAFGQVGTILRSTDSGKQWQNISNPATDELREAIIEPGSRNVILTGRDGTLLRTQDAGLSWEKLSTHSNRHFRPAAVSSKSGTIIAAGEPLVRLTRKE